MINWPDAGLMQKSEWNQLDGWVVLIHDYGLDLKQQEMLDDGKINIFHLLPHRRHTVSHVSNLLKQNA